MKRTPLKPSGPLKRSRLNPISAKRRKSQRALVALTRQLIAERGPFCEARVSPSCTGRADHPHHKLMQSQGGKHDRETAMLVCAACHSFIHQNTGLAYDIGLLIRRHEAEGKA